MLDDLIHYYTKNLGSHQLVFRHLFGTWLLFAGTWFTSWIFITLLIWYRVAEHQFLWFWPGILIAFLSAIGTFCWMNYKARVVVTRNLNLSTGRILWRGRDFHKYRINEFESYLTKNKLLEGDKLTTLIDSLGELADEQKFSGWFAPGLFLALVLPIWSQLILIPINLATTLDLKLFVIIIMTILVLELVFCINTVRSLTVEIYERKYRRTTSVLRALKTIQLGRTIG